MKSLWEQTCDLPGFPAQDRDISTDVLIIGGGMAGILCACLLHEAGADYVLAEAETICHGVTGNTTAKITAQHGLIYDKMIRQMGIAHAKQYWQANQSALERYRTLCREIDCDFENQDSWVYARTDRNSLEKEALALRQLGATPVLKDTLPLPFSVVGGLCLPGQAQFHPLKFISAISKGLHILEHTAVRELVGLTVLTDYGKIRAKKIIVATHFPFLNKHGLYPLKLYQHRSYVIGLEGKSELDGMYVDKELKGLSFRRYKNLFLLGGGSHRTGKKGGGWQELEAFARQYYPTAAITCRWATQDCMTLDGLPYIGPYSSRTQGLYVATGFNKWGMTTSMVAAELLRDMVLGKENPNAQVFSPSRSILRPQLAINSFEAITNILTPTARRCPHLGCALKWNKEEHTWDCSCHGSRFTKDGKLLNGPATGDLPE